MEVVIDGDPRVFPRVGLGHLVDEGLVSFCCVVITGEKVEHHLNLDDRIGARGFNQPRILKYYWH